MLKERHVAKNCNDNIASVHAQQMVIDDNGMGKMFCQRAIEEEDGADDEFEHLFLQMAFHQAQDSGAGNPLNGDCVLLNSCSTVNIF